MAKRNRVERPDDFMRPGVEYYLAGRFMFEQRSRISANLFHHGIELLLKYASQKQAPEVNVRTFNHDLVALWKDFKYRHASHPDLERFDATVEDLNAWEHLRYPSHRRSATTAKGVAQMLAFLPERGPVDGRAEDEFDMYVLCLEDMDDLFAGIIAAASINPAVLFLGLSPEAIDWYRRRNKHLPAGVPATTHPSQQ